MLIATASQTGLMSHSLNLKPRSIHSNSNHSNHNNPAVANNLPVNSSKTASNRPG